MSVVDRLKTAKQLIDKKWDRKSPLLLGCSGGPDSKALLYYLLEIGVKNLHVAHVDHGWREQSAEEASRLRKEVEELGLPFHGTRLSLVPSRNLEEHGRLERMAFFAELFSRIPFQALLLAHQKEDRAETSLKRLFEGAQLPSLAGLTSVAQFEGMEIWRPLLEVSKRELISYLDEKKMGYVRDLSNEDERFLRARVRHRLLPELEHRFGKNIIDNLCRLSDRTWELKEYLDHRTKDAWDSRRIEEWGIRLHLQGLERIEARHVLMRCVQFSRQMIEKILDDLACYRGPTRYSMNGKTVFVRKKWVDVLFSESLTHLLSSSCVECCESDKTI